MQHDELKHVEANLLVRAHDWLERTARELPVIVLLPVTVAIGAGFFPLSWLQDAISAFLTASVVGNAASFFVGPLMKAAVGLIPGVLAWEVVRRGTGWDLTGRLERMFARGTTEALYVALFVLAGTSLGHDMVALLTAWFPVLIGIDATTGPFIEEMLVGMPTALILRELSLRSEKK